MCVCVCVCMYINIVENIFTMVMDMKERTKNNIKTRMNIPFFCHSKKMKLVYDGSRVAKSKANFALDKKTHLLVYQWLKNMRFPDGYARFENI